MDFIKQFEEYSTIQLLRIIDSPNDYQPDAVEAAKTIISNRQLPEEEIEKARDELNGEKREKERELKDNPKDVYQSVFDAVNPVHSGILIPEKAIKIISIALSGLFLFQLYRELKFIYSIFIAGYADWSLFLDIYFLPLLVLAAVIVLFYKRKKAGWFLLAIYLIFSAISAIGMFIMLIKTHPAGIEALDVVISSSYIFLITHILTFIFCAGIIGIISKENIRAVYSISEQTMINTITITTLTMIVLLISYLVYSYGILF